MKPLKDIPKADRPREKLQKSGPEKLSDKELIAAIIGRGVPGRDVYAISREISRCLQQKGVHLSCEDLLSVEGVGPTKACQIVAAFELARRFLVRDVVKITSPEDILPLVSDLNGKKQEHFLCLTLNGAGELIAKRTVTVGLLNHSPVHPREVYADAITDRAASVIFVHNHPSGDPSPSSQDVEITRQLQEAGAILGIRVLDHIVVGKRGWVSLKQRGLM
ncbi:MAG: DNA repair protein RadC [Methanomicrobiaceae archaeon]|nr:DNA repair protein RadC [Methanomicrobiaceae archaeon]